MRTPEKFAAHFTEAGGAEDFLKWQVRFYFQLVTVVGRGSCCCVVEDAAGG